MHIAFVPIRTPKTKIVTFKFHIDARLAKAPC